MGQILDRITENVELSEQRETRARERREEQMQRYFATYNERLTSLEDRFKAHMQSVARITEDVRMGLGVASSTVQSLKRNVQGLSNHVRLMDISMSQSENETQSLLTMVQCDKVLRDLSSRVWGTT